MNFIKENTFISRHLPSSALKWRSYFKIFIPIIIGSIMFALNGVVDNFMVGHINQGQAALGAINSWTGILMGYFIGTAAAGSVIAGQFYHAKKFKVLKEISRYRYYISMFPTIILVSIAWSNPEVLAKVWIKKSTDTVAYDLTLANANAYVKVIAVQWLLITISFNIGNQLREIGYGKYAMYYGIGTLFANVALNSILMYGLSMGVEGAAWASVAGRVVALTIGGGAIFFKKLPIGFKPWTIFNVSWETRKLYWRRWLYMISIFSATFFVIFRNFFYSRGFPANDNLGIGISGLSIVALTGALMNIFLTTFSSLASMSANFVGSELGKGNIKQARINSDELKGFATTISIFLSILLVLFATAVPYMSFLARTKYESGVITFDGKKQLLQVSHALYVISFFYPMWIWFSASYRNGNSGGKGGKFAIVDWTISLTQLGWLAIIVFLFVPNSQFLQQHFWATYSIFFLSDILKLILQEILYYRYDWLNILTKEESENKISEADDFIQGISEIPNSK